MDFTSLTFLAVELAVQLGQVRFHVAVSKPLSTLISQNPVDDLVLAVEVR